LYILYAVNLYDDCPGNTVPPPSIPGLTVRDQVTIDPDWDHCVRDPSQAVQIRFFRNRGHRHPGHYNCWLQQGSQFQRVGI